VTNRWQEAAYRGFHRCQRAGEVHDAQAFAAIKEGLKDADGKTRMKAIEGLSDDEITRWCSMSANEADALGALLAPRPDRAGHSE